MTEAAKSSRKPECRVGTSGWYYDHWLGRFYPDNLKKDQTFGFYSQILTIR